MGSATAITDLAFAASAIVSDNSWIPSILPPGESIRSKMAEIESSAAAARTCIVIRSVDAIPKNISKKGSTRLNMGPWTLIRATAPWARMEASCLGVCFFADSPSARSAQRRIDSSMGRIAAGLIGQAPPAIACSRYPSPSTSPKNKKAPLTR